MIRCDKPFVLYADCEVTYDGRASSTLRRGRYLIIRKNDGCLLIHNNSGNPAQNYQNANAQLTYDGRLLICKRKKESITITIYAIIEYIELSEWSDEEVKISKTEKELVDKIATDWNTIINIPVNDIVREYATYYGPIDLVGVSDDSHIVVEVKRGKVSLNHCSQLGRYHQYFVEKSMPCVAIIASPQISQKALRYLQSHGFRWICVNFN